MNNCPAGTIRFGDQCVAQTDSGVPAPDASNEHDATPGTDAGNDEDVGIEADGGIPGSATISAFAVDFGRLVVGGSETKDITVQNATTKDVVVRVGIISGAQGADYGVVASDPITPSGILLEPGKVVTFSFTFSPRGTGARAGALAFELCADGCPVTVTLSGTGLEDAITCAPPAIDFQLVNPNSCLEELITCTNGSDYGAAIVSAAARLGSSAAYAVSSAPLPINVAPASSATVAVAYCPTGLTADTGTVDITTDHPEPVRALKSIALSGMGGGPDLQCTPASINFGTRAVGQVLTNLVSCTNAGNVSVAITSIFFDAASAPEFSTTAPLPVTIAPFSTLTIPVQYAPLAAGVHNGALLINSNDRDTPVISISLFGEAVPPNGCTLEIAPAPLDFGAVRVNTTATLGTRFINVGSGMCGVELVGLSPSTAAEYTLSTPPQLANVAPGDSFLIEVAFEPTAAHSYAGIVTVNTTDLAMTTPVLVDLTGSGVDASYPLLALPASIDFGVSAAGCADPAMRTLRVTNTGVGTTLAATIESGSSGAFTVNATTAVTVALPASSTVELSIGFAPALSGDHFGRVRLTPGALPPIFVELTGNADGTGHNVQTFTSPGAQVIDLLLVVDDSCSMAEEQANLAMTAATLIARADLSGADYHIAVTTTDPGISAPAPPGGTLRGNPTVITGASPTRIQDLQAAINVGTNGSPDEMGLYAATEAVTNMTLLAGTNAGFLRSDGELVVLVLSDEEDLSPSVTAVQPVSTFVSALLARPIGLAGAVRFYSITGGPAGCIGGNGNATSQTRYLAADTALGGFDRSICDPNYTQIISDIADEAFDPTRSIYQLGTPPAPNTIQVFVDNVNVPAMVGTTIQWGADYALGRVVFASGHSPSAMSTVRIEYDAFCARTTCGNGSLQTGEQCDDGNLSETDGCPTTCYNAFCGDGFIRVNSEQCDDDNTISGDGCNFACVIEFCGNGYIEPGEDCDNGTGNSNTAPNACRTSCVAPGCGDAVVDTGEQCDDANGDQTDACVFCQNARCGDGAVQAGVEQCDDGNTVNNDNCTNACTYNLGSFTITTVTSSPLTPATGGTAIVWPAGGDEDIVLQSIGFSFNYLGATVTDVSVVSNGYLAFEPPATANFTNTVIPDATSPNAYVAWWWDDLHFGRVLTGVTTSATTQMLGTAPNRRRVFTFVNVPRYNSGGTVITAEVTLFETTNVIEVHYGSLTETTPLTPALMSATVGYETTLGLSGNYALPCASTCANAAWPTSTIIRYTP